jgi:arsenate reductase
MAEGILRNRFGDRFVVYSAGTKPTGVSSFAVKVMAEIGIDISQHMSKHVRDFKNVTFDYVVTVCDRAHESCPFFPGAHKLIHKGFTDPSDSTGSMTDTLATFRWVRDEIADWIETTFGQEKAGD